MDKTSMANASDGPQQVTISKIEDDTKIEVFERWSAETFERFVIINGKEEFLYQGYNPYGRVPWVKPRPPENP